MAPTLSLTTAQAAQNLTRNDSSWSEFLNDPTTVTYAYRASIPAGYQGEANEAQSFERFTAHQIKISETIFNVFEEVCGIKLQRVSGADGYSNNATMLLGNYDDPNSSDTYGYSYTVGDGNRGAASIDGDFWYNLSGPNEKPGVAPNIPLGSDNYNTILHELGHSLGLEHPTDYPDGFTYENDASYIQDSLQYTAMSYFAASETGADHKGQYLRTLGLHDIAALQRLYGANMATRTGDDTYGFGGKGVYGLNTAADKAVFAIWDAGGRDTLNFSKYSNTETINLNAEKFSSTGGLKWNMVIAKGVVIENAIGGSGKDTIIGNGAANTLNGGKGDDILTGGAGKDKLIGGTQKDYFDFNAVTDSAASKPARDVITDFRHSEGDKIDLSGIDAIKNTTTNDAFVFLTKEGATFTKAGQLHFDQQGSGATAITLVEGDINGDGKADFSIELTGLVKLVAGLHGDFIL